MICPHCDYVHGLVYRGTDIVQVKGEFGDWWKLPVRLDKHDMYEHLTTSLHACPKCRKTFIGDDDAQVQNWYKGSL